MVSSVSSTSSYYSNTAEMNEAFYQSPDFQKSEWQYLSTEWSSEQSQSQQQEQYNEQNCYDTLVCETP
ncbi:MAG: hypothetical protein EBZ47_03010 [Chlamydiae bacterium]|nr:hypothetical protein [Chlamydiota bacterium]